MFYNTDGANTMFLTLFELCHVYFLTWANEVKKKPLHAKADCSKGMIWTPELSVRNAVPKGISAVF